MNMKFQTYFLWVPYCVTLCSIVSALPATSPFNANKLANKIPKRGNGLRKAFSKDTVRYFLYSNISNPDVNNVLRIGDVVSLSPYDATKGLTLVIHGFKQNYTDKYPQGLKNALLKRKDAANIVVTSWQGMTLPFKNPHAGLPLSTREASKNVQRISKHIVDFIVFMKNETKLEPSKVHLVGYGLGAHIAGVVGFKVKHVTGESIGRITGLDPSGPTHTYTALSEKLDKTDADFVDVIHTANGPFGPEGSIGHVDFYPNGGGPTQPQCLLPADPQRDMEGFPGSCSSTMAWSYFIRSILEDGLKACEAKTFLNYKLGQGCKNEITFGYSAPTSARGDYFLSIRSQDQSEP